MVAKNEVRLIESRGDNTIRRLVFTVNGFVQMVDDLHLDDLAVDLKERRLTVREIVPTVKLTEEDWVVEITHSNKPGSPPRMELFRFDNGRLHSTSLTTGFMALHLAISKNREINKWLTLECVTSHSINSIARIFPNRTWNIPTAIRQTRAILRNQIPCDALWDGETDIAPEALVLSYHKLSRLFSSANKVRRGKDLSKLIQLSKEELDSKLINYVTVPSGKNKTSVVLDSNYRSSEKQVAMRITEVGELNVGYLVFDVSFAKMKIYDLELVTLDVYEPDN